MRTRSLLAVLALAVSGAPTLVAQGEPFRGLTFDAALAAAKSEGKVVMIDFFTTWCEPCKLLDQFTWTDPKVRAFLVERTVALKIDAEKEAVLARRLRVETYPTMVFLKPDGEVLDRLVGFRDAEDFLKDAADSLTGNTALARARAKLVGHEEDPLARQMYAKELARAGLHDEALTEYLWCFDHGKKSMPYLGVRLSFLLNAIAELGEKHPPALAALRERRDAAEALVTDPKKGMQAALEVASLSRVLGDAERTLALYDRLLAEKTMKRPVQFALFMEVREPLIRARRYADFIDGIRSPSAALKQDISLSDLQHALQVKDAPDRAGPFDPEVEARMNRIARERTVSQAADSYEALLGMGDSKRAGDFLEQLLAFDCSGKTFAILIRRAIRAGDLSAARALVPRGREAMVEEQMPFIISEDFHTRWEADKRDLEAAVAEIPTLPEAPAAGSASVGVKK